MLVNIRGSGAQRFSFHLQLGITFPLHSSRCHFFSTYFLTHFFATSIFLLLPLSHSLFVFSFLCMGANMSLKICHYAFGDFFKVKRKIKVIGKSSPMELYWFVWQGSE